MLRKNILFIGLLALSMAFMAKGQPPEKALAPEEMAALVKKVTVQIELDEEEIEKMKNKTIELEDDLKSTRAIVDKLKENQIDISFAIKAIHSGVDKLITLIKDMNSTMVTKEMLIPTEYDDQLNCKVGCQRVQGVPTDCAEAMKTGHGEEGVYLQHLPEKELSPFGAHCTNIVGSAWTVIQRRLDGSENFHRNWQDYENGFGKPNGEYWLGLKRIHALASSRKHELWIQLTAYDGETRFALFTEFSVGGADENYKLTIGGHLGSVSNSMNLNNGMQFSTYDKDNDVTDKLNCAASNGGWWYSACTYVNLNGRYVSNLSRVAGVGIYWRDFKGFEQLKSVFMAIRPKKV